MFLVFAVSLKWNYTSSLAILFLPSCSKSTYPPMVLKKTFFLMNMENQSQFYVSGLIDLFMLTVHILYST